MKKFKKLVATALVAVMVLTTMALSASAGIVFWHGNESKRCYASTTHDNQTDWCADHLAGKKRKHSVWGQDRKSRS